MKTKESGYILVTGMVFILIISLVTISTMNSTTLDYKISSNESFKNIAFQSSETGRTISGDALGHFIYHQSWDGLPLSGLTIYNDYDPSTDGKIDTEDLYDTTSLNNDISYNATGTGIETVTSQISIIKSPGVKSAGSGLQQLSGYEGLGKGAGAGGIHLLYEIRSTGQGAAGAVAVTASEFKVIP